MTQPRVGVTPRWGTHRHCRSLDFALRAPLGMTAVVIPSERSETIVIPSERSESRDLQFIVIPSERSESRDLQLELTP